MRNSRVNKITTINKRKNKQTKNRPWDKYYLRCFAHLSPRALLFCAWLRVRKSLGNPETGVFLIHGFREELRTRTWLFILFRAKVQSLLRSLLCERRLLQIFNTIYLTNKEAWALWQHTTDIWEHERNVENTRRKRVFSTFLELYSNKTWIFDQSERALGPIYILNIFNIGKFGY